jgi:hypothetical protein
MIFLSLRETLTFFSSLGGRLIQFVVFWRDIDNEMIV